MNVKDELIDKLIDLAFAEDIGDGDHTTLSTIPADAMGKNMLLIKEDGVLAGELADPAFTEEELTERLAAFPVVQMESLPSSRYLLNPRSLLHINAKQLSGYGGSLDTAVTDLTHYLTAGYAVLVLCGGKVRATNLQELLEKGMVFIDGRMVESPAHNLREGDVISVRHQGRFRYEGTLRETNKGRLRVSVRIY